MNHEYIWQHLEESGWEHVRVSNDHPGWTVYDSILVREHAGCVQRGGYTLVTDKRGRALELRLMMEEAPGSMNGIHLLSEREGLWTDADGQEMPQLSGCSGFHIAWSPLPQSLAAYSMAWLTDSEKETELISIHMPDLTVSRQTFGFVRETESICNDSSVRAVSTTISGEIEDIAPSPSLLFRRLTSLSSPSQSAS